MDLEEGNGYSRSPVGRWGVVHLREDSGISRGLSANRKRWTTVIKKKIKFSSYVRKSRMAQLQSHLKEEMRNLIIYEEAVSHI
jgi:hypothetical protein